MRIRLVAISAVVVTIGFLGSISRADELDNMIRNLAPASSLPPSEPGWKPSETEKVLVAPKPDTKQADTTTKDLNKKLEALSESLRGKPNRFKTKERPAAIGVRD